MKRIFVIMAAGLLLCSMAPKSVLADGVSDNHTVTIQLPEVALLDIEAATSKNITMGFTAPTEAGLGVTWPSNNTDLWLNYSSIVGASTHTSRKVTVAISAAYPGGTFTVAAAAASSTGDGTKGTPASTITLSTTDQDLITGIGSCYTGDGVSKGHQLTYALALASSNYSDLRFDQQVITVTYTLVAN